MSVYERTPGDQGDGREGQGIAKIRRIRGRRIARSMRLNRRRKSSVQAGHEPCRDRTRTMYHHPGTDL